MPLGDVKTGQLAGHVPDCPTCGAPMVLRSRKRDGQQFFGCSKFPKCYGTMSLGDGQKLIEASVATAKGVASEEAAAVKAASKTNKATLSKLAQAMQKLGAKPARKPYDKPIDDADLDWLLVVTPFD